MKPDPPRLCVLQDDSPTLEEFLQGVGEPPFRRVQILDWVFRKKATSFAEMTDLSSSLRLELDRQIDLFSCTAMNTGFAEDGTGKVLLRLADGETIEAVLIREEGRSTACVSTQVGCPVGCPFCASGLDGTVRNLRAHEIVEQVLLLDRAIPGDLHLTHLVVMGIGEPLLNFTSVQRALQVLNSPSGFGMGARRMTLSTVGPRGKIDRLDTLDVPVNLAISLHAPDDELRERLVPGSCRVDAIVSAARRYRNRTGREVTFEYVLLQGVNADPEHARRLAALVRGLPCTVNLIPVNPVPDTSFRPPGPAELRAFRGILEAQGVQVTMRKRKGRSIEAACGQLRRSRSRS